MKYLIIIVLLFSCSSNSKKARKFMEAGSWEKARQMWMLVLQKKPADEEALAGKNAAEFKIMNKYVVSTRQYREAGDHRNAIEAALTIHDYLKEWNRAMDPDMAKYQSKELKLLYPSYLSMLHQAIDAQLPLKASYERKRFYPLFESIQKGELIPIDQKINEKGKHWCANVINNGIKYPFWRLFITKACHLYNIKSNKPSSQISSQLYSQLSLTLNISALPSGEAALIQRKSLESFRQSPWFHTQGIKTIATTFSGNYRFNRQNYQEKRSKKYSSAKEEKQEKSRFKEKVFSYYVMRHRQEFLIEIVGKIDLLGQVIQVAYKKEHSENDWSYQGHSGTPYISSKKANISEKRVWFNKSYQEYYQDFLDNLKQAWRQSFCQNNGNQLGLEAQGDFVIRCLRLEDPSTDSFTATWHLNNFGIDHHAMKNLIGRYY